MTRNDWRSFEDARKFVRKLKLKGYTGWIEYCKSGKKPDDIPTVPHRPYKKEWKSWGDWFGTGRIQDNQREYRSFEDARKFVRKLNLKSSSEWRNYVDSGKKPDDIPSNANNTYRNKGWISWGDFLGTGTISVQIKSKNFLPPREAGPMIQKLRKEYGLKNKKDWKKFAKSHPKLLEKLHLPSEILRFYSLEQAKKRMKK